MHILYFTNVVVDQACEYANNTNIKSTSLNNMTNRQT